MLPGKTAFRLYDTYGFPIEMTIELATEKGLKVDQADFAERFKQHQATSQAGAEQRFKGGLADSSEQTARLHTATHLMLAGLKEVLSPDIQQKGSNITAERLRFDFTWPEKMTDAQIAEVEKLVNEWIGQGIEVTKKLTTVEEAKAEGIDR